MVKTAIWGLSLGSGTSGGVLAPVFMIGGALGALEAHVLPPVTPGFWALVGLAAVVGGVMRSPLTGVVFPLELTHAWPLLLPLLIAADGRATRVSALLLKRSVLTEKIARRGLHLTREYSVDPLEVLLVDEVMRPPPAAPRPLAHAEPPVHAEDTLREVANRFAVSGLDRALVFERTDGDTAIGEIVLRDLLEARLRDHKEEHHRERLLEPLPRRFADRRGARRHPA